MKSLYPKSLAFIGLCAMALPLGARTLSYDISVQNTLAEQRTDMPVVIDIATAAPDLEVVRAVVTDGDTEVPCQLDDMNNDGRAEELAFVINMLPNQTKNLQLVLSDEGEQAAYEPRVYGNFMIVSKKKGEWADIREVSVPGHVNFYNYCYGHGPMFESELVGYRVYFNEKQTLDPYGKFNKGLELADTHFYTTAEQAAQGYGDDVLTAGNSCGVGAFKGWDGNAATHIAPVAMRTERLVSAGPVRTVVEVEVRDWDYKGHKLDMVNRYTLYAGHRDLQIDVEFSEPLPDIDFCTGVERVMGDETLSWSDHDGLVASWGRWWPVTDTVHYAKETIGIATYVPRRLISGEAEDTSNFLYTVKAPGQDKFSYNTMFTSRKETFGFPTPEAWFAYLPEWKRQLENPLIVELIPHN